MSIFLFIEDVRVVTPPLFYSSPAILFGLYYNFKPKPFQEPETFVSSTIHRASAIRADASETSG